MVKNPSADGGDAGSIPGSGRSPGEGSGNPLQYSCLENPHGLRSLSGYSPRACKELDTTYRLSAQACIPCEFSLNFFFLKKGKIK